MTRLARSGSAAWGSPLAVVRALQVAGDRALFGGGSGRIVGDHAGAEADGGDGDDRAARGAASVVEDGQVGGQGRVVHGTTAAPGIILDFSRRGKPTDNATIESFNGRFREECLNVHWFASLEDAQQKIDAFGGTTMRIILTGLSRGSAPMNTPGER